MFRWARARRHTAYPGPNGAAWLTDGGLNAIVRVEPETGQVKAWTLPEETGYANLNTATFDPAGVLWFTGQAGIYGRLEPGSGEMRIWKDPDGPGPYGITTTPDGRVFFASLAGSHIAEIDTRHRGEAADRSADRTKGHGGSGLTAGAISGSASGTAASSAATPRPAASGGLEAAGRPPARLCGLCRRAIWSGSATSAPTRLLSFDPSTERFSLLARQRAERQRAPDPWPQGRGLPARIRARPDDVIRTGKAPRDG